jgi:hypothetical protein
MSKKPSSDFNARAKKYLFNVVIGDNPKKDYSTETKEVMGAVRALVKEYGIESQVTLKSDKSLSQAGVFMMNAPAKFAAKVSKLEGVLSVEKPAARKAVPASKRSSGQKTNIRRRK